MRWSDLLAAPPPHLAIRYRTGQRRRTTAGEALLVVTASGAVTVDRWREEDHDDWAYTLPEPEAHALFAALAATGYPELVGHTVPPGQGLLAVEVVGGPEVVPTILHRTFVRDLPAWADCIARLDALCTRASGGVLHPGT